MRNPRIRSSFVLLFWSVAFPLGHRVPPSSWSLLLLLLTTTASSTIIPPFPKQRFIVFADLSKDASNAAIALGYEEAALWNVPGTYELEFYSYHAIVTNETTTASMRFPNKTTFETNANVLGLNESNVWDCWQNHYLDYDWTQLENVDVQSYWITLGYANESQWNSSIFVPDTEDLYWSELTNEQQQAARQLCFMEGSWNELPLILYDLSEFQTNPPDNNNNTTDNNNNTSLAPTMTAGTTITPTTAEALEIVKPDFRYVPWSELEDATRTAAEALAYDEETWNEPGMAVIEDLDWESIKLATPESIPILRSMGYSAGPTWDCFINHYAGFVWNELTPEVRESYETLGWTETYWNSEALAPASESIPWKELSDAERAAAERVCYFDKLWDRIPLTEWENTENYEPTLPPTPSTAGNIDGTNQSGTIASRASALVRMTWIWMAI